MRRHTCLVVAALLLLAAALLRADPTEKPPDYPKPAATTPDEPMAERLSLPKAGEYLDAVAVNWTRERKCGTCHTNYPYLMARPLVEGPAPALTEVRNFFEDRVANWETAKPRWDTE